MIRNILLFLSLVAGLWPINTAFASVPSVVASIPPFYDLVASVMEGVGTPKLLVKVGASPHSYSLRPSEAQMIKDADILFWAGPGLESFLVKPLAVNQLQPTATVVQFDKIPGLVLLPLRQSPDWHSHEASGHDHQHLTDRDMHFWLDPDNAALMIDTIVNKLSDIDIPNAKRYQQNGKNTKQALKRLDLKIKAQLKRVKQVPYIVFHDAYQYFEQHYHLQGIGALTLHPEVPPSAQRIASIRNTIQKTHAVCVFSEPQFQPKLVQSIVEDTGIKTGVLDPLGTIPKAHQNGYVQLLENMANAFHQCLRQGP